MERPLKKAVLDLSKKELGLKMISFVEDPAIQIHFITMSKHEETRIQLSEDNGKVTIFTPVLIPNQKILRNINGEVFDLFFDAETIQEVAHKWEQDNLFSKSDVEHSQQLMSGVRFYESVLSNEKRWANPKGFEELPLGTWYLTGEVTNPDMVAKIKNKEINGVSIDGLFEMVNVQANKHGYTDEELKNILSHL